MLKVSPQRLASLKKLLDAFENGEFNNELAKAGFKIASPVPAYVVYLQAALPAMNGTTPGSCSALYYKINSNTLASTGITTTVYNITTSSFATNTYQLAIREPYSGNLIVAAGGSASIVGILTAALPAFGSAPMNVYNGNQATGASVTVTDWVGYNTNNAGYYCVATNVNGTWYVVALSCAYSGSG